MSQDAEPKEPISVEAVLMMMVEQLSSIAWQKLGLQPDFVTGKIERDLAQAKLAIDATADLTKHVDSKLDEEDRRKLSSLIRDLRINYVEKTKELGA
ncbi:MAG: DUF1844 domain-containing protein [Fimbriimonas sp.]